MSMRRLAVFLLLLAAAGCATVQRSEPVLPELDYQATDQMEPLPPAALHEEQRTQAGAASETPRREPEPTALPPKAEPTPPAMVDAPRTTPAPRPSAQPAAPRVQPHKPAAEKQEPSVAGHSLQGLVALAARNDEKILQVSVGMYQKTVRSIMSDAGNPYKRRTITGSDGQVYEVMFYLTREPRKGKPITDRMLTPVIFRKGQVVAIGLYQYKKLQRTGSLGRQKPAEPAIRAAS